MERENGKLREEMR